MCDLEGGIDELQMVSMLLSMPDIGFGFNCNNVYNNKSYRELRNEFLNTIIDKQEQMKVSDPSGIHSTTGGQKDQFPIDPKDKQNIRKLDLSTSMDRSNVSMGRNKQNQSDSSLASYIGHLKRIKKDDNTAGAEKKQDNN
jgi:hypothetical protein